MFEYIKGKLTIKKPNYIAIENTAGVAYRLYISLNTYESLSNEFEKIYVYTVLKEESLNLYGFYTEEERSLFELLINISGIGAKLAIMILSYFNAKEFKRVISEEDEKTLIKVPGLGVKKAKKLILDIKDKMKNFELDGKLFDGRISSIDINDLYSVFYSLGFNEKEISKFIESEDLKKYSNIEEAVKSILKNLNK